MQFSTQYRDTLISLTSFALFLSIWQVLAILLQNPMLPMPMIVFKTLWLAIRSGELPYHLGITLLRLGISFFIAMLIGCTLGILLGWHPGLNKLFDQWLIIFLNIPALVSMILCYVWFGLTETAAILAVVLNKIPNVVVTIREGTRAMDQELLEMARCFHFSKRKILVHVIWPQLHPFMMAATRSGLALIWKIILVVELLGRSNGMGYQLNLFFQLFDVANILAYTIAFVSIVQCIEYLILQPIESYAQRWRR